MKGIKSFMTQTRVVGQSLLERTLTRNSPSHSTQNKCLTFEFEPVSKAELDQLTRELALYQALHPRVESCGGWWSYGNGRWALETCADQPNCCVCSELLKKSTSTSQHAQDTVTAPSTSSAAKQSEAGPSRETRRTLKAAIKSKLEEVNTLSEQLSEKQLELDTLRAKLCSLDKQDSSCDLSIPTPSEPSTPSWHLAKSVKQVTTLKTVAEGKECDFGLEFTRPLPMYFPFSLVRREQGRKFYDATESTSVISPHSFQVLCKNMPDGNSSSSVVVSSSASQPAVSSHSDTVTKFEFPELCSHPAPSTASHHLVSSVNRSLKTITEGEECDFAVEFSQPLATHSPLSLISREQGGQLFVPKESTTVVAPSTFHVPCDTKSDVAPSTSSASVCCSTSALSVCSSEPTTVTFEFPAELPHPAPSTPSYHLVKSVRTMETIFEDEENDYTVEFSQPLPSYSPLSLVLREQCGHLFVPKESTTVASPHSFQVLCESTFDSASSTSVCSSASQPTVCSCEPVTKVEFPELPDPAPATPSYHLVKSVRTMETIFEDEENDYTVEFSQPLPSSSPLSLVPRKQRGQFFEPKESTARVNAYSFLQASQSEPANNTEVRDSSKHTLCEAVSMDGVNSATANNGASVEEEHSTSQELSPALSTEEDNEVLTWDAILRLTEATASSELLWADRPSMEAPSQEHPTRQSADGFNIKNPGLPNRPSTVTKQTRLLQRERAPVCGQRRSPIRGRRNSPHRQTAPQHRGRSRSSIRGRRNSPRHGQTQSTPQRGQRRSPIRSQRNASRQQTATQRGQRSGRSFTTNSDSTRVSAATRYIYRDPAVRLAVVQRVEGPTSQLRITEPQSPSITESQSQESRGRGRGGRSMRARGHGHAKPDRWTPDNVSERSREQQRRGRGRGQSRY